MYATSAPPVSTPIASSLWHCPTELAYLDADDLTNIVHYSAASKSRPGDANIVALDTATGASFCNCRAAECGRSCWHQALAQAAWDGSPARILAGKYTNDQLRAAGSKAAHMCRWARHRRFRVLPADQLALLACRAEYRRRFPAAAEVAPKVIQILRPRTADAAALVALERYG